MKGDDAGGFVVAIIVFLACMRLMHVILPALLALAVLVLLVVGASKIFPK